MMQIIVIGEQILNFGQVTNHGTYLLCGGTTYPIEAIQGYAIVDGTVPSDFMPGKYIWQGGAVVLNPSYIPPYQGPSADALAEVISASMTAMYNRQIQKAISQGNLAKALSLLTQK